MATARSARFSRSSLVGLSGIGASASSSGGGIDAPPPEAVKTASGVFVQLGRHLDRLEQETHRRGRGLHPGQEDHER